MKEYIEREAALNFLEKINPVDFGSMFDYKSHGAVSECLKEVRYGVEDIPAASVAEVRHGKWVEYPRAHYFKCSECKYTVPYRKAIFVNGNREYDYCPSCGARMGKEDEHEAR